MSRKNIRLAPRNILSKGKIMHLCIFGVPVEGDTLSAYLGEMETILLEDALRQDGNASILDCKQHLTVKKRLDKNTKKWVADVYASQRGVNAAKNALEKHRRAMMFANLDTQDLKELTTETSFEKMSLAMPSDESVAVEQDLPDPSSISATEEQSGMS